MSVQLQPQPQQQVLEFAAPQPVIVARAAGQIVSAAASSAAPSPAAAELWAAVQFEPGPDSLTPGERDAHRRELIDLARRFTPRVSFEPPDALLFELAGSCRLFGGLRSLLQQLRAVFPAAIRGRACAAAAGGTGVRACRPGALPDECGAALEPPGAAAGCAAALAR